MPSHVAMSMGVCNNTEWRDFQIVDMKVDNRHMALLRLKDLFPPSSTQLSNALLLPDTKVVFSQELEDHSNSIYDTVENLSSNFKYGLDLVTDGKTALDFSPSLSEIVERLLSMINSLPGRPSEGSPVEFSTKTDYQDDPALANQKRQYVMRHLYANQTETEKPALTSVKELLKFILMYKALGTTAKSSPMWLDYPDNEENLSKHNTFWVDYFNVAKSINMKSIQKLKFDLEVSRQPITVREHHSLSLNTFLTTMLVSPYDTIAITKAHDSVMDDQTLPNSLINFGHKLFTFYDEIYIPAKEQYQELMDPSRKTSTKEYLMEESKKVRAFETAVRNICADVSFKLEVMDITSQSRNILYDDLSQIYQDIDNPTMTSINGDLGCPEGIQWILQENLVCGNSLETTTSYMDCWYTYIFIITVILLVVLLIRYRHQQTRQ